MLGQTGLILLWTLSREGAAFIELRHPQIALHARRGRQAEDQQATLGAEPYAAGPDGLRRAGRRLILAGGGGAVVVMGFAAASGGELEIGEPVRAATAIDAHLHIWSDGKAPYPWAEGHEPPHSPSLGDGRATAETLLEKMDLAVVEGALIVQPITHKFDHSYVRHAIKKYPSRFKGMCLANPTIEGGAAAAVADLEMHHTDGFVGVRFNPGLWPPAPKGSDSTIACGEGAGGGQQRQHLSVAAEAARRVAAESPESPVAEATGVSGAGMTFNSEIGAEAQPAGLLGSIDEFGNLRRTTPAAAAMAAAAAATGDGVPTYSAGRIQGSSSTLTLAMQSMSYANLATAGVGMGGCGNGQAPASMLTKINKGISFHERHDYSQPGPLVQPTQQNPNESMFDEVGQALFKRAGELGMPVGFMCFKGFDLHATDIIALIKTYPETAVVIDHFGFFRRQDDIFAQHLWEELLSLSVFPSVHVKASAFGRVSEFDFPYPDVRRRLEELVAAFGAGRVLFGSDFPYILDDFPSGSDMAYTETSRLLYSWRLPFTAEELHMIQRGTAEKLFGKWGK